MAWDAARAAGLHFTWVADDDPGLREFEGVEVKHPGTAGEGLPSAFEYLVAIGDNATRARVFQWLRGRGGTPLRVVHPSAVIAPSAVVQAGTLVCAGVVVNPAAAVGENAILNTACSVDHDNLIGDHVHLCPGVRLGGSVRIGEGTMVGLGAVVLPGIRIGAWSVIGAGSMVNRNVPDGVVAHGNPVRIRREVRVREAG